MEDLFDPQYHPAINSYFKVFCGNLFAGLPVPRLQSKGNYFLSHVLLMLFGFSILNEIICIFNYLLL